MGLLLGALAAGAGMGELALRAFGLEPPASRRMRWEPQSPIRLRTAAPFIEYIPGAFAEQVFFACRGADCRPDKRVAFRINSLGLRDRELGPKRPGVVRVLCLGDSFTVGYGVKPEEAWPKQLERLLNERAAPKRFEVVNAAVEAYSTFDEWHLLRGRGLALEPDLVVVGFYLNDPLASIVRQKGTLAEQFGWMGWDAGAIETISNVRADAAYPGSLFIARWLRAARDARRRARLTVEWYRTLWSERNRRGLEQLEEALQGMGRLSRERKLPFLVTVFPRLDWLDGRYPFEDIHERVAALCARNGLPSMDLLPSLKGPALEPLWHHPSDHHPSAELHRRTAELVFEKLAAGPEFKALVSAR